MIATGLCAEDEYSASPQNGEGVGKKGNFVSFLVDGATSIGVF